MSNIFLIVIRFGHVNLLEESTVTPKIFYVKKLQAVYRSISLSLQAYACE